MGRISTLDYFVVVAVQNIPEANRNLMITDMFIFSFFVFLFANEVLRFVALICTLFELNERNKNRTKMQIWLIYFKSLGNMAPLNSSRNVIWSSWFLSTQCSKTERRKPAFPTISWTINSIGKLERANHTLTCYFKNEISPQSFWRK